MHALRVCFKHQVVYIFLLTFLQAATEIKSLSFCFNATFTGFRLTSSIIEKTGIANQMECIVSCVQEPCCRSLNYRKKSWHDTASVCELLHDLVYNTSATLEKSRFYDHVYFHDPQKEYNSSCVTSEEDTNANFDLNFESKSDQNYVLLDNQGPEMPDMTLAFWINTLASSEMTVLSYAVEDSPAELSVSIQREKIILQVQSTASLRVAIPPINDGYWHHVQIIWMRGSYLIYLDRARIYDLGRLGSTSPLRAAGIFAIGQKLLSTNGSFDCEKSFTGKLSQLNMWNGVVTPAMNGNCSSQTGTIINWSALAYWTSGMVKKQQTSCMPLYNNQDYNIKISVSGGVGTGDVYYNYPTSPFNKAFTISMWIKHGRYSYLKYIGSTQLSFYLRDDALHLKIGGAVKKARVPMYWSESPLHWHHLATTWSSDTGLWRIFLDGSLVSIMHDVASGFSFTATGQLSLGGGGPVPYENSPELSRLNAWNYEVDGEAISLMANKGPLFENGNVLAWYGAASKFSGSMPFDITPITPSDFYNSRSESVYQMNFPENSVENYAKIENVFSTSITTFSACFWAKFLRTECGIFTYSTQQHDDEIAAYLYQDYRLKLVIQADSENTDGAKISTYKDWHFYCMQWRNSDGLVSIYQDARKLADMNKRKGSVISRNGVVVLGQELDSFGGAFDSAQAFQGSIAGLNFWTEFLTANEIQGMAAGVTNVNGNLLQWRDLRNSTHGAVSIKNMADALIPEYRVQKLRDMWCRLENVPSATYARFMRSAGHGYTWRCVQPSAMLQENMCYNISKDSRVYYTEDHLLEIL